MAMTGVQPTKRRRLWRRWLLALVLVAAALPLGVWGWAVWQRHRAALNLAEAIAEADRLDSGWRIPELEAKRAALPDERNSATVILALKSKWPKPWPEDDSDKVLPRDLSPPARLTADQRAALAKLLAPVAALLPEARSLADRPEGRFPISYVTGFIGTKMEAPEARNVAFLLRFDALDRIEAGDWPGAWTAWRAALNAARAVGDEPLIISQIVRQTCRSDAVRLLERILAQGEPAEADLARAQRALEDEEAVPLLLIAVRGERAGSMETIELLRANSANVSTLQALQRAVGSAWAGHLTLGEALAMMPDQLPAQQAAVLQHLNRLVEIAKLPAEEQKALADAWEAEAPVLPPLARMLVPAVGKTAGVFWRGVTELRCAIAAVAAERFRRNKGRWPGTLSELVAGGYLGKVLLDPFDGQPLRFVRTTDGLTIYGVGPDGVDNGGRVTANNSPAAGDDLGVRLWDVSARRR